MKTCHRCQGSGLTYEKVRGLAGTNRDGFMNEAICSCDMCSGKGHIVEADRERYYRSVL